MAIGDAAHHSVLVLPVSTGSLDVSTIAFYSELGKAAGLVIPIGVMAEISLPESHLRGLGLIARTELLPEELTAVGYLGERLISKPFEYLTEQFNMAWVNSAPGKALQYLAEKHTYSLHFSIPVPLDVPRQFLAEDSGATLKGAVREHLGSVLDDYLLRLIQQIERTKPCEELMQLKAAA
jgi:hypothetical protein